MLKLIRYHLLPFCKTCFSTSESFWHAKNNLVSDIKKWVWVRPPPQFGNFSHIIPFFSLSAFLRDAVDSTVLSISLKQSNELQLLSIFWPSWDLVREVRKHPLRESEASITCKSCKKQHQFIKWDLPLSVNKPINIYSTLGLIQLVEYQMWLEVGLIW